MKIKVNVNETLGRRMLFVRAFENIDYNTKKVDGTKIEVVLLDNSYEKQIVKVSNDLSEYSSFKEGDEVTLKEPEASVYVQNGFMRLSVRASRVEKEGNIFNEI